MQLFLNDLIPLPNIGSSMNKSKKLDIMENDLCEIDKVYNYRLSHNF